MFKMYTIIWTFLKTWRYFKIILFTLSLSLFLFIFILEKNSFNLNYYKEFQVDNKISILTNHSQSELDQISKDMVVFLKTGDIKLIEKTFNDKETEHMRDVYKLFNLAKKIKFISFGVLTLMLLSLYRINTAFIFKRFSKILTIIIVLILLLASFYLFKFNSAFVMFHEIAFTNDLWILDPKTEFMINLFPLDFFYGIIKKIFFQFLLILILIKIIISLLYRGRRKIWTLIDI